MNTASLIMPKSPGSVRSTVGVPGGFVGMVHPSIFTRRCGGCAAPPWNGGNARSLSDYDATSRRVVAAGMVDPPDHTAERNDVLVVCVSVLSMSNRSCRNFY